MENPEESKKRLEQHVKRVSSVSVNDSGADFGSSKASVHDMASPDAGYVGSMIHEEEALPSGMRRRVFEPPVGAKLGYHELGDEKEEADSDWMLGEASSLSGAGTRGSRNWVLKIMMPILLIVGIICMHQWWMDIKQGVSDSINAVGDAFDRRALEALDGESGSGAGGLSGKVSGQQRALGEERAGELSAKAVYSVGLREPEADAGESS